MIYLIAAREAGLAKIGYAASVARRFADLSTACPYDLEVIATRDGDLALEASVHAAALAYKLRREWFHFTPELIRIFSETECRPLDLIDDLGGVKAVATALGVNSNVVANWKLAGRAVPWKRRHALAKIAAERGIDLPADFWSDDRPDRSEAA